MIVFRRQSTAKYVARNRVNQKIEGAQFGREALWVIGCVAERDAGWSQDPRSLTGAQIKFYGGCMSRRPLSLIGSFLFLLAFFAGVFPAGAQTCCTIPQAESAQREGNYLTYDTEWTLTVAGSPLGFTGRYVYEFPPGGYTGSDSCWFQGSPEGYPGAPHPVVSGGDWSITGYILSPADVNGYDTSNYARTPYYQNYYGPNVQCYVTLYQGMAISCGDGWLYYASAPPGKTATNPANIISFTILSGSEVNYRDEFSGQQICAKEPQGTVTDPCYE